MIRSFFKDSFIYTLPTILSRGIGFFLLPIYTRILSPKEYGTIEILAVSYAFLNILLPLQITQSVARLMPDAASRTEKVLYGSTAFWFSLSIFSLFVTFVWVFPSPFALFLTGDDNNVDLMRYAVIAMLANSMFYVVQNQLKWALQPVSYAVDNVVFSLVTAAVSVTLIVFSGYGVKGYVLGQFSGACVGVFLGIFSLRQTVPIRFVFDWNKFREMLIFAFPLVFSALAGYLSMYLDRWMLSVWLNIDSVGLYGAANRIANIVALLVFGTQTALTPLVYTHYSNIEVPYKIGRLFSFFVLGVGIVLVALGLFSEEITTLVLGKEFRTASELVLWLGIAMVFFNVYVFAPGMGLAKKTKMIAVANLIAAIINVAANAAFIPLLEARGAAMATLLSGLAMAILYFRWSSRYYPIPYPWKTVAGAILLFATTLFIGEGIDSIAIKAFLLLGCAILGGFILTCAEERRAICKGITGFRVV